MLSLRNSALVPTDFGKLILDKLIQKSFPDIINEGYTAEVENQFRSYRNLNQNSQYRPDNGRLL
nr:hypothetical protein [Mycoplasmopsis bovis]